MNLPKDKIKELVWSGWKNVGTRRGLAAVRSAFVDNIDWWPAYEKQWMETLKREAYTLGEWQGSLQLSQWQRMEQEAPKEEEVVWNDSDLPELPKVISEKLLPYQVIPARRLLRALRTNGAALDASGLGTGKTFMSLAAIFADGKIPLVICPKAVIPSWRRACKHFGFHPHAVTNYESLKSGKFPGITFHKKPDGRSKGGLMTWYEMKFPDNVAIIFDEVHRLGGNGTLASKIGIAAKDSKIPTISLSATAASKPMQMKALGYILGLHNNKDFYQWCVAHGCRQGKFGMAFDGNQASMLKIHKAIFPKRGNRVRIEDLGDDFPETQISADTYTIEDPKVINQIYQEMEAEIASLKAREMSQSERQANVLVQMLRARQKAELHKTPAMCDMVEDAVEEGMSVAVFVNFNDTLDAMSARLKTSCVIRGGQKDDDRQRNIDNFQSDKQRVILCNIRAGGVGVSLHDLNGTYPRMSIISPTFSASDLLQATGRVNRAGGKTKSIQRIFFTSNSIEEEMCESVRKKLGQLNLLNDGDLNAGLKF